MHILNHQNLKTLNTFGLPVNAEKLVEIDSIETLMGVLDSEYFCKPYLILGGGSNVLFTQDFPGLVLKNELKGFEVLSEDDKSVHLKIGAGENWHETVLRCVENGWGGIENLSLIPGSVGAAPIQNIGAYGVELKDVLVRVHFVDLKTRVAKSLDNTVCEFGYRTSVFKTTLKNRIFITHVEIELSKKHTLHLEYGAIKDELNKGKIKSKSKSESITIKDVSNAVIAIRQSKLPDPKELGNSGSFFKNPVITEMEFQKLEKDFPDIRSFKVDENHVKLAAGWLIEQCGWKGKRIGNTGSHAKQALVLVNYGGAKGHEIWTLATEIIASVKERFDVQLEPEVNII